MSNNPSTNIQILCDLYSSKYSNYVLYPLVRTGRNIRHGSVLEEGKSSGEEISRGEREEEGAGQTLGAGRYQDGQRPGHQAQGGGRGGQLGAVPSVDCTIQSISCAQLPLNVKNMYSIHNRLCVFPPDESYSKLETATFLQRSLPCLALSRMFHM